MKDLSYFGLAAKKLLFIELNIYQFISAEMWSFLWIVYMGKKHLETKG